MKRNPHSPLFTPLFTPLIRRFVLPLFFLLILINSKISLAYELVMIQAVSQTKKTFVTRHGLRQGIIPGVTATFTAEDVSLIARAREVTGELTQWEVVNADLTFPFERGAMVTYYPATEYLWALSPEKERRKYIKSEIPRQRPAFIFKGSLSKGLYQSVSGVNAANPARGGYMGEIYYENGLYGGLSYDLGLRYEEEIASYEGFSFTTKRNLVLVDLVYYFEELKKIMTKGRVFISGGLGYGLSNTSTTTLSQSGSVMVLPIFKIGITLPFNQDWDFLLDTAFEAMTSKEQQGGGELQTTSQTNFKVGLGLKRFF